MRLKLRVDYSGLPNKECRPPERHFHSRGWVESIPPNLLCTALMGRARGGMFALSAYATLQSCTSAGPAVVLTRVALHTIVEGDRLRKTGV